MTTKVIKIDPENIDLAKIKEAASVIRAGSVVAFPTETVYGLAADFSNKRAVQEIFRLKKRPRDKPLPVQIADIAYLEELACDIPAFAYQLMSRFWPGPLTLVLPARQAKSRAGGPARQADSQTGGKAKETGTIGVRIPNHKIATSLLKECKTPLVVPSANLSGRPDAITAEEVLLSFDGLIAMVVDGGKAELGIVSTVVDLTTAPFKILREGAISRKDIQIVQD